MCSPLPVFAAVGDNCQVNLTAGIPDSQDWKGVYIVRGDDGSAWQRGIISNPKDALLIKEAQITKVTATVRPNAETEFFIYAADDDTSGVIKKPGEGVCFEGPQGNPSGGVSFPINARSVWGSLGKKLVVDVFYRMEESWDQLYGQKTNNNFLVGTYMLPKIVTVQLDSPPASEGGVAGQTAKGKWEEERAKLSSGANGECRTEGSVCKSELFGTVISPRSIIRLDPANLCPRLLGNNFDGVGGRSVEIGLVDQFAAGHTHMARFTDAGNGNVDTEGLFRITLKSRLLELIKRLLEGTGKSMFMIPNTTYQIGELVPENLTKNAESNEMIKAIKALLTDSGDSNAEAKSLSKMLNGTIPELAVLANTFPPDYFLELFPATSSDDSWSEDFLNILLFWTGSTTANTCVLNDIDFANFVDIGGRLILGWASGLMGGWSFMLGASPLILLNTTDPITLTPAFQDTTIVYAEKQFTDGKGWALPAGKKQPLNYRYDFTNSFPKERVGEMCVKQVNLPDLVASVGKAYQLSTGETATLTRELIAEFPATSDFVQLSLANPADIASRFIWQGDGKKLNLLQLFFEFTPSGCTVESLVPPAGLTHEIAGESKT